MINLKKYPHSEGYTFAELLLAMALLALLLCPLAHLFQSGYAGAARSGKRTAAVALCREELETLKARGYSSCLKQIEGDPAGSFTLTEELTLDHTPYRRVTRLQLIEAAGEPPLIHLTVTATWPESGAESSTEQTTHLETHLAPR